MKNNDSYYDRTLSTSFSQLIEKDGQLRWLFDFVKEQDDLDFLIGKNKDEEWISVYRGLSRVIKISKRIKSETIKIDGADAYKIINPDLYKSPITKNFQSSLSELLEKVRENEKFDRYYKNKKEGYYQNELSRKHGICGVSNSEFVIVDKEAVIGYDNQDCKVVMFRQQHQQKYKDLQKEISIISPTEYGKDLEKKSIGNELDFIAVDKTGNILLIEYKHGTNTSGIYLSPLQIGLYYDLFTNFDRETFEKSILSQLKQKQTIGLINSSWKIPEKLKEIIPVLILSEYNYKSSAKDKYCEIMDICREKLGSDFLQNIKTYNYTSENGLTTW